MKNNAKSILIESVDSEMFGKLRVSKLQSKNMYQHDYPSIQKIIDKQIIKYR